MMKKHRSSLLLDGLELLKAGALNQEERRGIAHYALGVVSAMLTENQARDALETVRRCIESSRYREEKAAIPGEESDGQNQTPDLTMILRGDA